MPLQRQLIDVPLAGGLETKVDSRLVPPGKLATCTNGQRTKFGTIDKRRGVTELSNSIAWTGTLESCVRLFRHEKELCLCSGGSVYAWSPDQSKWVYRDKAPEVTLRRQQIVRAHEIPNASDIAYNSGVYVLAWVDRNDAGVYRLSARVVDYETGTILLETATLNTTLYYSTEGGPRCCLIGNRVYVWYMVDIGGGRPTANLATKWIDTTSVDSGWSSESIIYTDVTVTRAFFDARTIGSNMVVAYSQTDTGTEYARVTKRNVNNALQASNRTASRCDQIGVAGDESNSVYVCWNDNTNIKCWVLTEAALVQTVAPTTLLAKPTLLASLAPHSLGTKVLCYYDAVTFLGWIGMTSAGVVDGIAGTHYRVSLLSRAFASDNTRTYLLVADRGGDDNDLVVLLDAGIVGTTYGTSHLRAAAWTMLGESPTVRGSYTTANVIKTDSHEFLTVTGGHHLSTQSANQSIQLLEFKTDDTARCLAEQCGRVSVLASGLPCVYDGLLVCEAQFARGPYACTATKAASAVGLGIGTYQYRWIYEYTDAAGNVWQSQPGVACSVTTDVANLHVDLECATLTISNRTDTERVYPSVWGVPYRTTVGGTVFYRLLPSGTYAAGLVNNPEANLITYHDTIADGNITSNPVLYSDSGILDHQAIGATPQAILHRGRVWAISDDRRKVYYSAKLIEDEGIWWNRATFVVTLLGPGDITALASLGDKLVIFREDETWMLYGDGPNDQGQGDDLTEPQIVSAEVGCVEPRSVVAGPNGVYFQADRGIHHISWGGQITFVGQPIVDVLGTYPLVAGAVYLPDQSQIRFGVEVGDDTNGIVAVHDTLSDAWSTYEYGSGAWLPRTQALDASGIWHFGTTDGHVFQESTTRRYDRYYVTGVLTDVWVPLTVESPWIRLGALQGYQRAWRCTITADRASAHAANVWLGYDYSSSYATASKRSWTSAEITALGATPQEPLAVHLSTQRCKAVRVKIYDAAPTAGTAWGFGEGIKISAATFEVAALPGSDRLPVAERK